MPTIPSCNLHAIRPALSVVVIVQARPGEGPGQSREGQDPTRLGGMDGRGKKAGALGDDNINQVKSKSNFNKTYRSKKNNIVQLTCSSIEPRSCPALLQTFHPGALKSLVCSAGRRCRQLAADIKEEVVGGWAGPNTASEKGKPRRVERASARDSTAHPCGKIPSDTQPRECASQRKARVPTASCPATPRRTTRGAAVSGRCLGGVWAVSVRH
jgi:hypothetical protein